MSRVTTDFRLPAVQELLAQLLSAAQLWTRRQPFDGASVEDIRHRALLLNHQRYADLVPAYRRLAEDLGLLDVRDFPLLVNELMVTDELFKSYDDRWLESNDFAQMTAWLGDIFLRRPGIGAEGIRDITTWRKRLHQDDVHLSYSSGTSGRFSFVPRDRLTWEALCRNGSYTTPSDFDGRPVSYRDFDCLVLGFRGNGMGIQGAGTGLARVASRSQFLFDVEMTPDMVRALGSGRQASAAPAAGWERPEAKASDGDAAYARAFEFLAQAQAAGRPALVFGTPHQIHQACLRALAEAVPLRLPSRSIVVSGGGWKAFDGQRVTNQELSERIESAFGIPRSNVIDTYSTSELNCVLTSCPHSRFHVPPLLEAVVLDDMLARIDSDDAAGILGFLDPFALSYPGFIITGDVGRLTRRPCACGLQGWSIDGEIQRASGREVKGCGGVLASVKA